MPTYYDVEIFAEEVAQWADAMTLEAAIEEAFHSLCFTLDSFGEDESLPPAPHGLVA